jgi:hypothetical protein
MISGFKRLAGGTFNRCRLLAFLRGNAAIFTNIAQIFATKKPADRGLWGGFARNRK